MQFLKGQTFYMRQQEWFPTFCGKYAVSKFFSKYKNLALTSVEEKGLDWQY